MLVENFHFCMFLQIANFPLQLFLSTTEKGSFEYALLLVHTSLFLYYTHVFHLLGFSLLFTTQLYVAMQV